MCEKAQCCRRLNAASVWDTPALGPDAEQALAPEQAALPANARLLRGYRTANAWLMHGGQVGGRCCFPGVPVITFGMVSA